MSKESTFREIMFKNKLGRIEDYEDLDKRSKKEHERKCRLFLSDLKQIMKKHNVEHVDICYAEFAQFKFKPKGLKKK